MSAIKTKLLEDSEKAKVSDIVEKEAEKVKAEMEMLIAVVKQLNETCIDQRLDVKRGVLEALDEIRSFHQYLGGSIIICVNGNKDSKGEPEIWFEA